METRTAPAQAPRDKLASAYRDMFERSAIDAAFLWHLRSVAVNQPHYYVPDIAELDQRVESQLDLLMTSLEEGWQACEAALELQQPGEAFTATMVAMRSHDIGKIQTAVQSSIVSPAATIGVVSALGWLPSEIANPWLERLLKGKDLNHKYLGVAACSVRRANPGEVLTEILKREDCRKHEVLYARCLRIIGELRRQDLMPALEMNLSASEAHLAFWANWSSVLLGQRAAVQGLKRFAMEPGPYQARAIQLAFRVLAVEEGREWISSMAKNPKNIRAVITATGVLGDPHAVNWLISKMAEPEQARLASEAFTNITGVDFEKHQLSMKVSAQQAAGPNDDPADENVGLDEDENLPWPNANRVAELWRNHGQHFLVGRRYFLGKDITADWLKNRLAEGAQRQRHAAAMELALIDSQSRLLNTHARVSP